MGHLISAVAYRASSHLSELTARDLGGNGNTQLRRNRSIEVDSLFVGLERDEQGVADGKVKPVLALVPLPPSAYGIDGDRVASGEFLARSLPYVLME